MRRYSYLARYKGFSAAFLLSSKVVSFKEAYSNIMPNSPCCFRSWSMDSWALSSDRDFLCFLTWQLIDSHLFIRYIDWDCQYCIHLTWTKYKVYEFEIHFLILVQASALRQLAYFFTIYWTFRMQVSFVDRFVQLWMWDKRDVAFQTMLTTTNRLFSASIK